MPTQAEYRKWFARELAGKEIAFTCDSGSHSTTTIVDVDASYLTASGDFNRNDYIFAPALATADNLRMISSFASATGTYTITPAISAGSVWNSAAYEIHKYLDPKNAYPLILNEALKRIPLAVTFNFAPVANSYEQDITTQQSWLTNRQWVRGVSVLGTDGAQHCRHDSIEGSELMTSRPCKEKTDV